MNSKFLTINFVNIKGALVSGVLMALFMMLIAIKATGSIYNLDYKALVDVGAMALTTSFISLLKSFFTDETGTFAGAVKVADKVE